jgi:hypothetical protein
MSTDCAQAALLPEIARQVATIEQYRFRAASA